MDLAGARYAQSEEMSSESREVSLSEDSMDMEHLVVLECTEVSMQGKDFHFFLYLMTFIGLGREVIVGELELICRAQPGKCRSGNSIFLAPRKQRLKELFAPGEIEDVLIVVRSYHLHSSFILAYLTKERIDSFFLSQEHPPFHVADLFLFYTAEGSKWYNSGSFIETVAL